jgi:hypothetical protein
MLKLLSMLSLATIAFIPRAASTPIDSTTPPPLTLYVASQEKGILAIELNPAKPPNESLQIINTAHSGYLPGWLSTHDDLICSISRTEFPANSSTPGGIFTWRASKSNELATLQAVSNASSEGLGGVYCGFNKDASVLAAANM